MGGKLCKDTSVQSVTVERASVSVSDVIEDRETRELFKRAAERISPRTVGNGLRLHTRPLYRS